MLCANPNVGDAISIDLDGIPMGDNDLDTNPNGQNDNQGDLCDNPNGQNAKVLAFESK